MARGKLKSPRCSNGYRKKCSMRKCVKKLSAKAKTFSKKKLNAKAKTFSMKKGGKKPSKKTAKKPSKKSGKKPGKKSGKKSNSVSKKKCNGVIIMETVQYGLIPNKGLSKMSQYDSGHIPPRSKNTTIKGG